MSQLQRFIFEALPVRGAIVRLTDGWQELLERRTQHAQLGAKPYPTSVRNLLGEMSAASILMHSLIQFKGTLILQILGGEKKDASPVKLAVAEVRSDLSFRATATLVHEVSGSETFSQLINANHTARCALTLDPDTKYAGQQAYQGIVPLSDSTGQPIESMAQILEHYMQQSEQLETKLVLAADEHRASGILIQRMPTQGQNNLAGQNKTSAELASDTHHAQYPDAWGQSEDFNRIAALSASITAKELLQLEVEEVLHRLFWNEPLARYETTEPTPQFRCTCSRTRVANTLRQLGQSDTEHLLAEKNAIQVNCDFCGQLYQFDAVDAAMLFAPTSSLAARAS